MSTTGKKALLTVALLNLGFEVGGPLWKEPDVSRYGAIAGFMLTLSTPAVIGLYIRELLCDALDRTRKFTARPRWRFSKSLTVYFVIMCASLAVADRPSLWLFQVWMFVQNYLLFSYIANRTEDKQAVLFIIQCLLIGVSLNGLAALLLNVVGQTFHVPGFYAPIQEGGVLSRVGLPGAPNLAASYLSMTMSLGLGVLLTNLHGWPKRLALIALILGGLHLLLTFSRGGWIECFSSALIISIIAVRRGWMSRRLLVTALFIAAVVSLPLYSRIATRLTSDDAGAAASRLPLNGIALRMIVAHPILGVGANNFAARLPEYVTTYNVGDYLAVVHNTYLLIWSETGIAALLAFLAFLSINMRNAWRCSCSPDRFISPIALAILGANVGFMIHMTVEKFAEGMDVYWVLAGLMFAIYSSCSPLISTDRSAPSTQLLINV
jgi:O-antigen ligase